MNSLRSRKLILFGFWLFNVYKHQISLSFFGGRENTILKNPIVMGLPRSVVEGCGSGLRLPGSDPQEQPDPDHALQETTDQNQ